MQKKIARRSVLGSLGLMAGAGFARAADNPALAPGWQYHRLIPEAIAPEAMRLYHAGGCMYGVFGSVVAALAKEVGEPFRSFPLHMMQYGAGGAGGWGSLCGTLNGAAALIGLFEPDKKRREKIIGELFCWYEMSELPVFQPTGADEVPRSVAGSVLCHVSVGHWCKAAECDAFSKELKERCSRLTADVAAKTVELLNRNLDPSCTFAGITPAVRECISCHGEKELADTRGTMQCGSCHKLPEKHPIEVK